MNFSGSPRYFSLKADSRLGVNTVSELKFDHPDYVSRFGPGPLTVGFDGTTIWTPTVKSLDGILLVQKSLAEAMLQAGLAGLEEAYPVVIRKDWPAVIHKERLAEAPEYVWFRLRRDIAVDPAYFTWPASEKLQFTGSPYRAVPVSGSHGGADIFGVRDVEWTALFCTRSFVEFARQKRWKGFLFCPMDMPHNLKVRFYVDYLNKHWPPERWYPEGVEGHPDNLEPA